MNMQSNNQCPMCREEVKIGAKKCKTCHYCLTKGGRNTERVFKAIKGFGYFLALCGSLIGVFGWVIPKIDEYRLPNKDSMIIRVMGIDPINQTVNLFITNTGRGSGAIKSAYITVPPEESFKLGSNGWPRGLPTDTIVLGNSTREISLCSPAGHTIPREAIVGDDDVNYGLLIIIFHTDGSEDAVRETLKVVKR